MAPRARCATGSPPTPTTPSRSPSWPRSSAGTLPRATVPGAPSQTTPEAQAAGADDAVWALAEELAHSPRAWFPLVELARLSVAEDIDGAVRRLSIATDRDPTGQALLEGLIVLREAGLNDAALALGTGHWRPAEHKPEVGREMVLAALAAGRLGEAKRHRAALMANPDVQHSAALAADLEKQIAKAKPSRSLSASELAGVASASGR